MSEKAHIVMRGSIDWGSAIPVLRYVLGSAFIVTVTGLMNYDLAYLTWVLSLGYLAPGARPLTFRQGVGFVVVLAALTGLAVLFTESFQDYPMVFMPLLLLTLLWLYFTDRLPMMVKLFALISIILIPFLSIDSTAIGTYLAVQLVFNALMAVVLTQFVFMLFPLCEADIPFEKEQGSAVKQTAEERLDYAIRIILILTPVIVLFYLFQWSSSTLILTFIAVLTISPALSNPKVGAVMIVANTFGGLFGILAYNLLVIVPSFIFMIILVILIGLFFGSRLFSSKKTAGIFGSAFSTFLLILGSVTSSDAEAGGKVWDRLIQIAAAVIYVVVVFALIQKIQDYRTGGREFKQNSS